jgi:hypothetical protein
MSLRTLFFILPFYIIESVNHFRTEIGRIAYLSSIRGRSSSSLNRRVESFLLRIVGDLVNFIQAFPPAIEMALKVVALSTPAWRVWRDAGRATDRAARERMVRVWKCMVGILWYGSVV